MMQFERLVAWVLLGVSIWKVTTGDVAFGTYILLISLFALTLEKNNR